MFCFAEISTDVSMLLASLILINTKAAQLSELTVATAVSSYSGDVNLNLKI